MRNIAGINKTQVRKKGVVAGVKDLSEAFHYISCTTVKYKQGAIWKTVERLEKVLQKWNKLKIQKKHTGGRKVEDRYDMTEGW